ncbi:MAG: ABC transporter substrate-binding protein [Chloroflexi bacterium]|nr:ABC transporter substrate-binding protein [Chloroflexota bacterium]
MALSKVLRVATGVGVSLVLLVVSCAPAAEPTAPPTTAPAATTAPAMQEAAAPPTPTPAPVGEQFRRGGTLLQGYGATPNFVAWELCCSEESTMAADSILQYRPANKPLGGDEEIEGRMAYDWSVSRDGLSWTFKLEKGMTAALPDGTFEAVDCDDVAWSVMKIKTGEGLRRSMRGRTFAPVTKVECPDPLTAVIYTKAPYGALPGMLAVSINVMLPKGYWESRLKELSANNKVVGSGPWKLETYSPEEIITYVPNPRYHRLAPDGKPYPYLARLEGRFMTGPACAGALRTGRVHICSTQGVNHWGAADTLYKEAGHLQFIGPFRPEDNPEWSVVGGGKGLLGNGITFYQGHHGKAPWNNVKIREALSLALDRRTLCELAMEGWCNPGPFAFVVGSPWNLPKEQVWSYPGYNVRTVEENIARARQLLQQEGYKLYPDPAALTIKGLSISPGEFDGPARDMLRRGGFNPDFKAPEFLTGTTQAVAGEFDVVMWNQIVSHPDPNQVCYEHYYTGSDRNYGRYANPQADALCDKMGAELDRGKRIELAHQLHKFVLDDHARAILHWYTFSFGMSPELRGWRNSGNWAGGSNPRKELWWVAK